MSQTPYRGRQFVQEYMPDEGQHRREIARAVNVATRGQLNGSMSVTLTASVATTTIYAAPISISSVPIFAPTTAHAAAEIAAGGMYFTPSAGQCVVTHANNAQTDRTFNVIFVG